MGKIRPLSWVQLLFFVCIVLYISYALKRFETGQLLASYGALFALYLWIWKRTPDEDVQFWCLGSLIVRASVLFVLPNLSDDFYRFIWDGRLWLAGEHPFAALPADFLARQLHGLDAALFDKLNSKEYFTIYPPVAQFIFLVAVKCSPDSVTGSVVWMKICVLLSEAGSIALITRLLRRFQQPPRQVLLYALNPLVILEFSGNLHFETFVIFFLLLSLWLLGSGRIFFAAVSFALAVGVKLLPVILLPLLLPALGWRRALWFYAIVGISCILLFIPLYDEQVLRGFSSSLTLYFSKFEFNASIYYLVREFGFINSGYNTIQSSGWRLAVVSGLLVLAYSMLSTPERVTGAGIFARMTFILLIYLLFVTTLHPWYITTLLAFSVFTRYRFMIVWTAMIFLTYAGYAANGFSEILWLTALEYVAVLGYLGYELLWKETFPMVEYSGSHET